MTYMRFYLIDWRKEMDKKESNVSFSVDNEGIKNFTAIIVMGTNLHMYKHIP